MTGQVFARPRRGDDSGHEESPLLVPFGGMLSTATPSTTTGLGMRVPRLCREIDRLLAAADAMTNASSVVGDQFWTTYVSTTDTGIAHVGLPLAFSEEVRLLRDEISRRTRLTRQQIARAAGADRRSLTSWANGSAAPGPDRLERLRHLCALVREIDAVQPGRATEILLARRRGGDLLDMVAEGRFDQTHQWQSMGTGQPSVHVTARQTDARKPPLFAAALAAYREGKISVPPRARTVRDASVYEQDLDEAEATFPDQSSRARRRHYR
jgi:transcriptional regulator with XRE-family HTH domain